MKSRKILSILLASLMLLSVGLTGCASKEPTAPKEQSKDKIDADQTLNIVGYDFTSLDPSAVSDAESFTSMQNVYEGLMREIKKDGVDAVELAGASDMKKSADGLVYTFTIRDSKWSDGKAVTAQDYEYSWKRLINPESGYDYLHFLDCVKGVTAYIDGKGKIDDVGIKAKDAKTFEVTLAQPTVYFEKMLIFRSLVPQREDVFKALAKDYGQDFKKMVYNGPFVVSDYAKGSKIVYKKNENYWDAKNVKLVTANCNIIDEPTTLVKMFEAKQLDMTGASGDDLKKLSQEAQAGQYEHVTGVEPSVFYYTFNTKSPILVNAKVRKALSLAYDRQQQIDAVWQRNISAFGIVPSGMIVGDKEYRKSVEEPIKQAIKDNSDPKALLMEGLKELNITDPSKVSLKLLMGKASTTTTAQAQFIQNQWQKNLGIKIEIQHAVDGPSYFQARTKGEFDICAGGWGADFNDLFSFFGLFTTGDGNNNGKYSSKEFDDLIIKSNAEADSAKRLELFKQAEQLLVVKDAAVSPYYYRDTHSFRQKYLKGMFLPLFGGYYDLRDVYIQGK